MFLVFLGGGVFSSTIGVVEGQEGLFEIRDVDTVSYFRFDQNSGRLFWSPDGGEADFFPLEQTTTPDGVTIPPNHLESLNALVAGGITAEILLDTVPAPPAPPSPPDISAIIGAVNQAQEQCGDGWFSRFLCENPQTIMEQQVRSGFQIATAGSDSMESHNTQLTSYTSTLIPINDPNCQDPFSSDCGQSLRSFDCQGDEGCQRSIELAQIARQEGINQQRIPNSGMIRAAQMLRITPQASAASSAIQSALGIEFSLIQEGSGIDDILRYGTPEQICFAKVDSFISVNGLEVEGQVMEVDDDITGMSSVIRACDNLDFEICADLRAERSGIYFNNSFTLFVHVFVRNIKDYPQMVTLHANLRSGGGRTQRINVVELSDDVPGEFILLNPGQTFSRTLYLSEIQVFRGEELKELYGNVAMGVFRASGVNIQDTSNPPQTSNSQPSSSNDENGEDNVDEPATQDAGTTRANQNINEAPMSSVTATQGSLEYALDYPILTLGGTRGSNNRREIENSGVSMTGGTTAQSLAVVRRVSLD